MRRKSGTAGPDDDTPSQIASGEEPLIFALRDRPEWRRDPKAITFLKTVRKGRYATKLWVLRGGQPVSKDYDREWLWRPFVARAEGIEDLSRILTRAERYPDLMVVRGAVKAASADKSTINRRCRWCPGKEPPDLDEVPRHWVMIDLDSKPEPKEFDWREDTRRTAQWAADRYLPPELSPSKFHYQFTSGAGFKPGLRLHYWFWLDRPYGSRELKDIFRKRFSRYQFDLSLYDATHPHYMAAPCFREVEDPLDGRRSGGEL